MKFVTTENAAAAGRHYSQGVAYGGVVYVSGLLVEIEAVAAVGE